MFDVCVQKWVKNKEVSFSKTYMITGDVIKYNIMRLVLVKEKDSRV